MSVAPPPGKQFGLLCSAAATDLGDEIESIAARQFLPRIDHRIDRDRMHQFGSAKSGKVWVIANGDYLRHPENWPPSQYIRPLWVAMHISPVRSDRSGLTPQEAMLTHPAVKCLRGYGPVGARDTHTLELLRRADVESYFSGSLSLMLERPPVARDHDLIVLSDVPEEVAALVRQQSSNALLEVSHSDPPEDSDARCARALRLLEIYARAGCVITTRLHSALPCLAFGTPVLLIDTAAHHDQSSGLHNFLHHCTVDEFLAGSAAFDFARPPPNPDSHATCAEALRARVVEFVALPETADPYPDPLTLSERYTVAAANQGRALRSSRQARSKPAAPTIPGRRKTVLLQTSDAHVYAPILQETARVNREYCARHGLEYQSFIGIKRGYHPWHATFNRIPLLLELQQAGDVGWVLYLDADAYVFDLEFDVHAYLATKTDRACIASPGSNRGKWDVNAGVLFINLQHLLAHKLIELWTAAFASAISEDDLLASALPWSAKDDDQTLLQRILRGNSDILESTLIESDRLINYHEGSFVRQIVRDSANSISLRLQRAALDVQTALSRVANPVGGHAPILDPPLYNFLFEHLRNRFCSILFIGRLANVAGIDAPAIAAIAAIHFDRIQTWLDYLPNAHCFDINEITPEGRKLNRITVIRPDRSQFRYWEKIAGNVPPLSIVVDAGGEVAQQRQHAFLALFPRLQAGGHYVFEYPAGTAAVEPQSSERRASIADLFLGYIAGGTLAVADAFASDVDECTRRIGQVYVEREDNGDAGLAPVRRVIVVAKS